MKPSNLGTIESGSAGDVFLVDLTFVLKANEQSFYGAPILLGPQGEDNTVLYGVARDLLRLRKNLGIRNGVVVIGSEATTISSETTINSVLRLLRRLGAVVVYEPKASAGGVCRSLASVARWVVTQNSALFHLVSDKCGVILPNKACDDFEIVALEALKARLGVRPDQVLSFLALTEGGSKALFTKRQATRLLELHSDLEPLLQNSLAISALSSNQVRRQLTANKETLLDRLCNIRLEETACQLPSLRMAELQFVSDDENTRRSLKECGFLSLVRLLELSTTASVVELSEVKPQVVYKAIRNETQMRELEAMIAKAEVCAMDTEASDKDPRRALLFGVAFSISEAEAFYVPVTEADLDRTAPELIEARLRRLFEGSTKFVGHNVKFDYVLLRRHGITINNVFFDTMLAAYECFGDWEFFNLGALARKLLGKDIKRYRDIVGEGETLLDLPFVEVVRHACMDSDTTLQLYHRLQVELEKRSLWKQFSSKTMASLRTLADKECSGVRLNMRAVNRRREALSEEVSTLRRAVRAEAGKEFDVDSLTEITNVLRDVSGLREQMGRMRLTLSRLEELAGVHNLPRLIVKYGRAQKLVRHMDAICRSVKGGRVFPIFSQIRWQHGGVSSTDPRMCEPDGPLESEAVNDKAVRERMEDRNRSLEILQQAAGDKALKRDLRAWAKHPSPISADAIVRNLDQRDLLLSTAIGLSDAALCRRFLVDRVTVAAIRQTIEARYVKLFTWLDTWQRDTVTKGFGYHDGARKYLEGLKSSDINKKQKAVRSAVEWLIRR
jgi:DNA polymerase III epsilon subunit-like protein